MIITLQIFLYIYYAFLMIWGLFFLIALFHMIKYGFRNIVSFASIIIFSGVAVVLIFLSFSSIAQIHWQDEINLFGSLKDNLPVNF